MLNRSNNIRYSIPELSRHSKEGDFWQLLYVGNLSMNEDKLIMRELYLFRLPQKEYINSKQWNLEELIRIEIREEQMYFYPVGVIFDSIGIPVKFPHEGLKSIYKHKIILSNDKNFKNKGIKSLISETRIPIDNIESLNEETPYFYFTSKEIHFIIPNYLIAKHFYYFSISAIGSIIYGNIEDGLKKIEQINNRTTVFYDSNLIYSSDIGNIARYSFTFGKDTGLKKLKKSVNDLHKAFINNDKLGHPKNSNIEYLLPSNFPFEVEIIGQYINSVFVAYDIIHVKPYKDLKLFTIDDFDIFDINDKTSTDNRDEKPLKGGNKTLGKDKEDKISYINDKKATNSSIERITVKRPTNNFFYDSPTVKKIKREDQNFKYICDIFLKEYDGYGIDTRDSDPGSTTRKTNFENIKEISAFAVFLKAMEEIMKDEKIQVNYKTINQSNYAPYSFVQYDYKNEIPHKHITQIVIASIVDNEKEYCIIEAGADIRIGMFENCNNPFLQKDDPSLWNFVNYMLTNFNFRWSDVFYDSVRTIKDSNSESKEKKHEEIIKDFRINVLQPLEHIDPDTGEAELAENLANRIKLRITRNQ